MARVPSPHHAGNKHHHNQNHNYNYNFRHTNNHQSQQFSSCPNSPPLSRPPNRAIKTRWCLPRVMRQRCGSRSRWMRFIRRRRRHRRSTRCNRFSHPRTATSRATRGQTDTGNSIRDTPSPTVVIPNQDALPGANDYGIMKLSAV